MDNSKYKALASSLRQDIMNGKYAAGERLPSENHLSRSLGLSRQTVRQAMGLLESEGIISKKRGSGTYISPHLGRRPCPTKNIGVISTYIDSYIFPTIISGIEKVLAENGYTMQLSMTHNQVENEARALKMLMAKGVDGLIVEPTKSGLPNPNIGLYEQIRERKLPLIFFNAFYPGLDFPHICMDDQVAGNIAAKCLIDAGHRNIAGMFQSDDRQGHLRYKGFIEALREAGMEQKSSNIFWFATEDIPYLTEDIDRVIRCLAGCTGLVCYNDQIAYTIMNGLIGRGFDIPRALSVVGIDNADIGLFCNVPLTTVAHPMEKLGHTAAKNIISLIDNPDYQANVDFIPHLITRRSVKAL